MNINILDEVIHSYSVFVNDEYLISMRTYINIVINNKDLGGFE